MAQKEEFDVCDNGSKLGRLFGVDDDDLPQNSTQKTTFTSIVMNNKSKETRMPKSIQTLMAEILFNTRDEMDKEVASVLYNF